MDKYITKVRIPASPVSDTETQPIGKVEDLSLSDIMLDYIQGQYSNLGQAYEAFSDELNRRVYEAISQYQPQSPPDTLGRVLMVDTLEELVNHIENLRH